MSSPTRTFTASRFPLACAGAAAALALVATQSVAADDSKSDEPQSTEMTKGEQKLAKMLEGRVAGEPQRCIRTRLNDRLRVIDGTAYVYGSGRTIYVQRTKHPEDIDRDDMIVQRRFSASHLCRLDLATTAERVGGIFTGVVLFDDFVPYTRAKESEDAG